MARPIPANTIRENGEIEVQKNKGGDYNVIFTPPADALPRGYENREDCKRLIAQVNSERTLITFYPFKVRGLYSMDDRYYTLKSITVSITHYNPEELAAVDIQEIISDLPDVFIRDYNYGLGFRQEYGVIVSFIKTLQVKHLNILKDMPTSFDKETDILTISEKDLRSLKKTLDRITAKARKVALSTKHDIVTEQLLTLISLTPRLIPKRDRTRITDRITKSAIIPLNEVSRQKQNEAVEIVAANSRKMLTEQPEKLVRLRTDIDLVTLDKLIGRIEEMMEKGLKEMHWQKLFDQNPFIYNMAFGVPVVKVRANAYVGGKKIAGGGDKITDFLVKNSISNNAAIIEIKTPGAKLLSIKSYRHEVHGPSSDLSSAVNQILDQIYRFQKEIATLKENTRTYDIETYSVAGVLVIGKLPVDASERKSFELFRGNSKNIHIITFDELLEKLKQLKLFLGADDGYFIKDEDLPF